MAETTLQLIDGDDLAYQDNNLVLLEEIAIDARIMTSSNCNALIPPDSRYTVSIHKK